MGAIHIIVKTLFDGRADAKLSVGEQTLNGLGHNVGRAVPKHFFALFIIKCEDLQLQISLQGQG